MLKRILHILNFKKFIAKGNLPIVALCFFIASCFWVVKALNKRYNAKINIAIQFDYNKDKIVCRTKTPTNIWVDAQSTGWILLQHKLKFKNDTLVYRIGNFFEKSQTIDKEDMTRFVNNNVKGVLVNQLLQDNFDLVFEKLRNKTVKLDLDPASLLLRHDTRPIVNYEIFPKTVEVQGAGSIVRQLKDKYFIPLNIDSSNVDSEQIYYYHYNPDSSLTITPQIITIKVLFKDKN